jgi:hypothetical protein
MNVDVYRRPYWRLSFSSMSRALRMKASCVGLYMKKMRRYRPASVRPRAAIQVFSRHVPFLHLAIQRRIERRVSGTAKSGREVRADAVRRLLQLLFGMVLAMIAGSPLSEQRLTTPAVSEEFYMTSCMGRMRGRGRGRPSEAKWRITSSMTSQSSL